MTDETPHTEILQGDSDEILDEFDDNHFHAIVTDPPYNLSDGDGFMGREWDAKGSPKAYQEWCEKWATEALRVLKPGGHLIAFSGNRTHHRLFSAVEDAGFTVRDTITYLYGTGFPKGSDISKHIDRYYDAEDEREVVGKKASREGRTTSISSTKYTAQYNDESDTDTIGDYITAPATSEAERWSGFRTQLKPSAEFAVLARAPMSESAVYRNVLEHGTGALNIDRTRIPTEDETERPGGQFATGIYEGGDSPCDTTGGHSDGRYPANLLLGHSPDCEPPDCRGSCAARMLDSQTGTLESGELDYSKHADNNNQEKYGEFSGGANRTESYYGDSGGASRFFYTSKASKTERTLNGQIDNEHPTVKPLDLMEFLVTLVTAPGQRVLDPFVGSGTTIMACKRLGREGIGIEKDEDHAELARKRVELAYEIETDHVPATEPESMDTEETTDSEDDSGPATLESFGDDD